MTCPQCKRSSLKPHPDAEHAVSYRGLDLVIAVEGSVCTSCGASALPQSALQASRRAALVQRGSDLLYELMQSISLRQLEKIMGVSQGYLSRLKARKGCPSPTLVSLLWLLHKQLACSPGSGAIGAPGTLPLHPCSMQPPCALPGGIMSESVHLRAIFAGLSHELGPPLNLALVKVNRAEPDLCQVRGTVERVAQGCKLLSWLASTLAGEPSTEKVLRPCVISKTARKLASQNQIQVRVPDDLAVLAAWDALERVLYASFEYIHQRSHVSSPDEAMILASEVLPADANRVPLEPQSRLASSVVRLIVGTGQNELNSWLPVLAPGSKASFGDFLLQAGHYELWLCLLGVRAHGGDLWLEENAAGTVVTSLWRKAPKLRGFATLSRERHRQLASLGGRTAQAKGTSSPRSKPALPARRADAR